MKATNIPGLLLTVSIIQSLSSLQSLRQPEKKPSPSGSCFGRDVFVDVLFVFVLDSLCSVFVTPLTLGSGRTSFSCLSFNLYCSLRVTKRLIGTDWSLISHCVFLFCQNPIPFPLFHFVSPEDNMDTLLPFDHRRKKGKKSRPHFTCVRLLLP